MAKNAPAASRQVTSFHTKRNSLDEMHVMPNLSGAQDSNLHSSQQALPRRMAASPSALDAADEVRRSRPNALQVGGALNPYVDSRSIPVKSSHTLPPSLSSDNRGYQGISILPGLNQPLPKGRLSLAEYGSNPQAIAIDSSIVANKQNRGMRQMEELNKGPRHKASLGRQFNDEVISPVRS